MELVTGAGSRALQRQAAEGFEIRRGHCEEIETQKRIIGNPNPLRQVTHPSRDQATRQVADSFDCVLRR